MSLKVLYSLFNDEKLLCIDYLKEKHGWEPVYFHGASRTRQAIEDKYPGIIFQDGLLLRQNLFDYSRLGVSIPIDAELIRALSEYQFNCLSLMEDTTEWNFSFLERRRHYYDVLNFWNTVIQRLKPDLYVCFTQPHAITEYLLYLLCKHYFKIPVLYINPVPLLEKNYHVVCDSKEDISSSIKRVYESDEDLNLNEDIKDYLQRLRSEKGMTPNHIITVHKRKKRLQKFQIKEFMKLMLLTITGKAFEKVELAFKNNRFPLESPNSRLSRFGLFWFKNRLRRNGIQLLKTYNKFVQTPDLNRKYMYYTSSYQPEASTSPNAGVYEDQFLVLDMLSASIPDDWVIYFKEHPGVFLPFPHKGSLWRNKWYYERINSYPNVIMIPSEGVEDTFKLIDNAQAVASITSTAAWEAVVRGKPAMFFGNVWYQGCKSLFKINTLKDCQKAIEKIKAGYKPDQRDIDRYAATIQDVSVKGMIHRDFHENIKKCENPIFEMERIGFSLYEAYNKFYKNID